MDEQQEDALYNELKDLPDFLNLPLPQRWYKKYNIKPVEPYTPKEFLNSGYTFNCMFTPKELPPIIIDKPVTDLSGNVIEVKLVEEPPIPVTVITRPYEPEKRFVLEDSQNQPTE